MALFDSKRTQNVSIALGKIRKTPQQIVDLIVKVGWLVGDIAYALLVATVHAARRINSTHFQNLAYLLACFSPLLSLVADAA